MAYTTLYRKWRPARFEDVRGQEHIVSTLKNQITGDRVGHAYLFCGTRGTGKTTVAKIFARAVNCDHPVDGSPCNECAACQAILQGTSMNVMEIDAASNNSVENIRQIRDEVKYSPTEGRYRVYIIDEVHMLSIGAFNALLKTLEEPPSYVIFILATTEAHKIPVTILSRCQRYDFRRLTVATLMQQIFDICSAEQIAIEDAAVRYIAQSADGASRDALSLLEQCISFYYGQTLTYENVLEVLGAVDTSVFRNLLQQILQCNVAEAMDSIAEAISLGREMGQFVTDFIWYLRNLLLVQTSEPSEDALNLSGEHLVQLQAEARMVDTDRLLRYIRILSDLSAQLRYATSKRVLVEVALIKMMKPAMETDTESLLERIRNLEEQLAGGVVLQTDPVPEGSGRIAKVEEGSQRRQERIPEEGKGSVEPVAVSPSEFELYDRVRHDWNRIISDQFALLATVLRAARLSYEPDKGFVLLFEEPWHYKLAQKEGYLSDLTEYLRQNYDSQVPVRAELRQGQHAPEIVMGNGPHIPGIEMEIGMEE